MKYKELRDEPKKQTTLQTLIINRIIDMQTDTSKKYIDYKRKFLSGLSNQELVDQLVYITQLVFNSKGGT